MDNIKIVTLNDVHARFRDGNLGVFIRQPVPQIYADVKAEFHGFLKASKESDVLLVTFGGAHPKAEKQSPNDYVLPYRLGGMRLAIELKQFNHLVFSDPGQFLGGLATSFYLGTRSVDPIPLLLTMVLDVHQRLGTRHIIFNGGSAGGFAAYLCCIAMDGPSAAVVLNQQVSVTDYAPLIQYKYFSKFFEVADNRTALEASPHIGRFSCLVASKGRDVTSKKFYFLCNCNDPHFKKNVALYSEVAPRCASINLDTYNGPPAHAAPEFDFYRNKVVQGVSDMTSTVAHTGANVIIRGE